MPRNASQQGQGSAVPAVKRKSRTRRSVEKQQEWETLKNDVHRLYIKENETLQETMTAINTLYSFTASVRKWKMKLKEWGFEKYLSKSDMVIIAAKAEKRRREEGKETVFYQGKTRISDDKIGNFKRRRVSGEADLVGDAETPPHISYSTPKPDISETHETVDSTEDSVLSSHNDVPSNGEEPRPGIGHSSDPEINSEIFQHELALSCLSEDDQYKDNTTILDMVHGLGHSYPIFNTECDSSYVRLVDLCIIPGHAYTARDSALAWYAGELVYEAKCHWTCNQASIALVKYFGAIALCFQAREIDKEVLFEYVAQFLDLQERHDFLPARMPEVIESYKQLTWEIITVYGESGPITIQVIKMWDRFQEQLDAIRGLISRLFRSLFGPERCHKVHFNTGTKYSFSLEYIPNQDAEHIILDPDICLESLPLTKAGEQLWTSLRFLMASARLAQTKMRLMGNAAKREAYIVLAKKVIGLSEALSDQGLYPVAVLFYAFMIFETEIFMHGWTRNERGYTITMGEACAIIRLSKNELRRILPNMFTTIKSKVEEWLAAKVLCIEYPESSLPGASEIRDLGNPDSGSQEPPNAMASGIGETDTLDMPDTQTSLIDLGELDARGTFSVSEINHEETDECQSTVTDLRSSKYGFTYTESAMSGISFNYTALFPG
ncbi:hypothetical protein F5882DRAFT_467335 [Hyaloscypha sp. PMI_1271]|nr:hypothetical protein F5882DRAFT_467335 [Hyaloscypha sp. PMI_1271]